MRTGKILLVFVCFIVTARAQDITLELQMPGTMFGPGSPFYLNLEVVNTGSALPDAQLFVALTVGTGDFWFFPSWVMFPHEIDWKSIYVPPNALCPWMILSEFPWPSGAGACEGAMFFAAIMQNGMLMSNLADVTFGWTEEPVPTPTPTPQTPTHTPTSIVPTSTPTPSGPTPTPPPAPTGFVYIPPGSFMMGSPASEPCRNSEAQHLVTLTRGFYMMTTEVTRHMWVDLKAAQPTLPDDPSHTAVSPTLNHPVQNNTWYEVVLFANLMSLRDGYTRCYYKDSGFTIPVDATSYTTGDFCCNFNANGYRLPTEAEWEYACRAGTTGAFSCNESNYNAENCNWCTPGTHPALEQYCVYCANYPGLTAIVGSKLPNPAGLYDMHGNVYERCWDFWGKYPLSRVTDPTGPSFGWSRVVRGGGVSSIAQHCRSAYRYSGGSSHRNGNLGFRLVRTAS